MVDRYFLCPCGGFIVCLWFVPGSPYAYYYETEDTLEKMVGAGVFWVDLSRAATLSRDPSESPEWVELT